MDNAVSSVSKRYFGPELDFRARLFNVLAAAGAVVSGAIGVVNILAGADFIAVAVDFSGSLLSYALLRYSSETGKYRICFMITIAVIFLGLFPYLFFTMGGYHGGISAFFIFAVVFTVFMLEGKAALVFAGLELVVYTGICLLGLLYPEYVREFEAEREVFISVVADFIVVSVALGLTMFIQIRIYRMQQRKIDEQNQLLVQLNQAKSEFLANTAHEMKTPLTVISVHIQRAQKLFEMARDGDDGKIRESHALAQEEIMRLSRLVSSALNLAFLQESSGSKVPLQLEGLLRDSSEVYRNLLENNDNTLIVSIPDNMPQVLADADAIVQLLANLLSNANAHTAGGEIRVQAQAEGGFISVAVSDTGEGIAPDILERLFQRGVTSGGTGIGLSLCKQIAEDHGGEIEIESGQGEGTTVRFTLPIYAGDESE